MTAATAAAATAAAAAAVLLLLAAAVPVVQAQYYGVLAGYPAFPSSVATGDRSSGRQSLPTSAGSVIVR